MKGIAVAPQPPAVEAAIKTLKHGGNAIDAAVSAAFVQMIVEPQMCGVAGFGVANVRAADGRQLVIDFNGTSGSKARPDMWVDIVREMDWTGYGYHLEGQVNDVGYKAIMTPGTVAGLGETLRRFGTISWSEALQPAIQVAEEGFLIPMALWRGWNVPGAAIGRLSMKERLQATPGSRQLYIKENGETYRPGERFRNPDYARTLRRLAEAGPDDFYRGELARRMAEDFEQNGAFITADDLANYRVSVSEPLEVSYRGYSVFTNPPAGGGICLAETLKILEHEDIAALGLNSLEYIEFVAMAMKAAFHDWYGQVGDPRFVNVPVERLLSDAKAANWYKRIKAGERFSVPRYPEGPDTTNIAVVDSDGNCVSITHSLGASGGVVTPGLGFTYNNIMNAANPEPGKPNSIAPGKSRITGICPTIVLKNGEPVLTIGAPGGTRIITGVLQGILNILDHGLSPVEAVSAPRFDCQSDILDCESRIPSWVTAELGRRGFQINPNPFAYGNFAVVGAITRDPVTGRLAGGADPRRAGAVMEA